MRWSEFGERFAGESGIVQLMTDLGEALAENPDILFLGGGNPARIPAAEETFARCLQAVLGSEHDRSKMFGIYQSPQGDRHFRRDVAALLRREFGWPLAEQHIALTNGSQSAFFLLFNMLAGRHADGATSTIHLPVVPEYIGYADAGVHAGMFSSNQPALEMVGDDLFKYHVDIQGHPVPDGAAALCVSRPTNPTGNVLTDGEIEELDSLAGERRIPLIIDGAYGLPFPGMTYVDATPHWNDNTILVLSLSKLGLPGARTGIIVAREEITSAFANANTIMSLAAGNMGPAVAHQLFTSGEILTLSRDTIGPFYRDRSELALAEFRTSLKGLPYRFHVPEGGMVLWLWLPQLPVPSQQLYQRLKARGVLVVPGEHFFVAADPAWEHQRQCLRISYAQDDSVIRQGAAIIAEELRTLLRTPGA